jgi:hypothetical protein
VVRFHANRTIVWNLLARLGSMMPPTKKPSRRWHADHVASSCAPQGELFP